MLRTSDDIRLLTINDTCRNDLMESLCMQVASVNKSYDGNCVTSLSCSLKKRIKTQMIRAAFGLKKANGFVLLVSVIGTQFNKPKKFICVHILHKIASKQHLPHMYYINCQLHRTLHILIP